MVAQPLGPGDHNVRRLTHIAVTDANLSPGDDPRTDGGSSCLSRWGAGLSTGGVLASLVIAAAIVGTTAFAIVAFVGREQLRSFAIGFLIPVVAYSSTILSIGKSELDPYEGKLPATKLIQPVFEFLVRREYVDLKTNQPVPNRCQTGAKL